MAAVTPPRPPSSRYVAPALVAVALLVALAFWLRWNAHQSRVAGLTRAAEAARAEARAYSDASIGLIAAGKHHDAKYSAAYAGIFNLSRNGLSYFAVVKERVDAVRTDRESESAVNSAKRRFPRPDAEFDRRADDAMTKEQAARDQMTLLSTLLGTAMSNPFMVLGMAQDARNIDANLFPAVRVALISWIGVRDRASQLSNAAAKRERSAKSALAAQRSKSFLAALVDP